MQFFSPFQLCYQNKSCSECKQDVREIERQDNRKTERQKDRKTKRQKDRKTFHLNYQNKSSSECKQDVRKIERQTNRQKDKQIERQRLFCVVIKKKVVQNVGRMSESQTDRKIPGNK